MDAGQRHFPKAAGVLFGLGGFFDGIVLHVSGYTTPVDWAQSALTEFIYLDMILEKGLTPARAAEQLLALVRFSGDDAIPAPPTALRASLSSSRTRGPSRPRHRPPPLSPPARGVSTSGASLAS